MITDNEPLVCSYVSVPSELADLNVASWVAGIIQAFIVQSGFVSPSLKSYL